MNLINVMKYFIIKSLTLGLFLPPEGRPGIYDVSPLSGISGLSVWSHFSISPLLFFCLVSFSVLSYPFLLLAHSPDFLSEPPFSERLALLCGSTFSGFFYRLQFVYFFLLRYMQIHYWTYDNIIGKRARKLVSMKVLQFQSRTDQLTRQRGTGGEVIGF